MISDKLYNQILEIRQQLEEQKEITELKEQKVKQHLKEIQNLKSKLLLKKGVVQLQAAQLINLQRTTLAVNSQKEMQ